MLKSRARKCATFDDRECGMGRRTPANRVHRPVGEFFYRLVSRIREVNVLP